ncbi:hypothetical protein V2A60_010444 [Cordyceps javanica]
MSPFIDGIGVVSGVLGIIQFAKDNIPSDPPVGAAIRVKLGLGTKGDSHGIEGDVAATYAWDTNNEYLGKSGGAYIKAGDIHDFTIDQDSGGTRAEYVGVSAAKDAVCISWITVKMHDETEGGSWTGDVGYQCGQHWYHQSESAGSIKEGGEDYIPRCTWLDEDHTNDKPSAAMKFKTTAYGKEVKDTVKNSKGCDFTKWGPDNGPITDKPGKRALKPRQAWMEDHLVVSNVTQHSAEELCSSATSWGPDFIGSDGTFCDMSTKTLSTLCSAHDVAGCIDLHDNDKTITKRTSISERMVNAAHKSYSTVTYWG